VGVVAVATWAVGVNALLFALDKVSPVGSRPVLVGVGLLLTLLLTWVLTLRQRRGLPPPVGRRLFWQSARLALFAGAATYFVLMQIVMPVLFLFGVPMGLFRP
jgi:hypothetical protein